MDQHVIQWTTPAPLWGELTPPSVTERSAFARPAILRFSSDDFMQEYLDVLATDPKRLGEYRVVPETWRGKLASPSLVTPRRTFALRFQRLGATTRRAVGTGTPLATVEQPQALPPLLKLFQPAHQRFYMLSTCLVCQKPGLPDRRVDPGREERVSYLVRRLFLPPNAPEDLPLAQWEEYAWVAVQSGPEWRKVIAENRARTDVVVEGEERLPLFPATFQQDDLRQRRLLGGIVPVGKREAYLGASKRDSAAPAGSANAAGTTDKTARKVLLRRLVIEPWKNLLDAAKATEAGLVEVVDGHALTANQKNGTRAESRDQIQLISWLILLDFADFLRDQLPEVWAAVSGTRPSNVLQGDSARLFTALEQSKVDVSMALAVQTGGYTGRLKDSLREALAAVPAARDVLEKATTAFKRSSRTGWPDFVFPLADPQFPTQAPVPNITLSNQSPEETQELAALAETNAEGPTPDELSNRLDRFAALIVRALPDQAAGPQPEVPAAAKTPADNLQGVFVLRCVYERPSCGPLHEDVVSAPTEPFEMAGFFDPDAPARPIRIGLPLDTTAAGLRKFDKNTAFVLSDTLCGQMKRLKALSFGDLVRSVLPWPLHKGLSVPDGGPCRTSGGLAFGTVCSLSIPIITICALIVLMIMVSLLNMIFGWLPFLMTCFPVPGLRAKK
jgi:hypothetical protein